VIISVHNNENVLLTFYSAIETAICSSSFVNPADSGNVLVIFFSLKQSDERVYIFCQLIFVICFTQHYARILNEILN